MDPDAILTPRQDQICDLLMQGLGTKEVAAELEIEAKTADNHIQGIKKRFGVSKITEVVILCMRKKYHLSFDISEMERRNRAAILLVLLLVSEVFVATEFCSYRIRTGRRVKTENVRYRPGLKIE